MQHRAIYKNFRDILEPIPGPKRVFMSFVTKGARCKIQQTRKKKRLFPKTLKITIDVLPRSNGFTSRHRPTKIEGYKKTVVFDPSKSETYRALQEGVGEGLQEVTTPVQPRAFHGNRMVPGKKPTAAHPAPQPEFAQHVNSMGEPNEKIHQSGSFKRLMHHVMMETDY
ncbi:AAEL003122-PA [Aedes aegypti]|uniref:AAEL003122-PA n=1 Tax=Aedes aegypti TaxID=7159 RepID=Q17GD1_AEDAE|nr:AAEL003122-PA [Aedes aegypti]